MRLGSVTRTARMVARPSSSREIVAGARGTGGASATRGMGSAMSVGPPLCAKAGGDQVRRAPNRAAARVLSAGRACEYRTARPTALRGAALLAEHADLCRAGAHHAVERRHELGVELGAGALLQVCEDLLQRPRFAVGARGAECVEHVAHV